MSLAHLRKGRFAILLVIGNRADVYAELVICFEIACTHLIYLVCLMRWDNCGKHVLAARTDTSPGTKAIVCICTRQTAMPIRKEGAVSSRSL